jgi:hypothetical protein
MALKVERVVNRGMHPEETLSGSSRFKPLHLALSPPYRLMRVPRPIVAPKPKRDIASGEIFDDATEAPPRFV